MSADVDVLFHLFESCHAESSAAKREAIAIDSPFPPFGPIDNPWSIYMDMFRGRHYKLMPNMASWRSRPYNNKGAQVAWANTTYLCDNRPQTTFLPRDSSDFYEADLASKANEFWWGDEAMDVKMKDTILWSRVVGLGVIKLGVDTTGKQPHHYSKVVNPDCVLFDPDTTCDNWDPQYVIYRFKTTVGELMKQAKKKGAEVDWEAFRVDYVAPDDFSLIMSDPSNNESAFRRFNRGVVHPSTVVWAYEMWMKDGAADYVDVELGDKVVTLKKPKYPNGRVITFGGGKMLWDESSPYDHGEIPFIPYFAYTIPGRAYPMGDIEITLSQVVYRNKVVQVYLDSLTKSTGAIYLRDPRFMKSKVTNDPIQEHEVTDVDRALKVVTTGNLRRHETDLITLFDKDADDAGGLHDYSMGQPVPGNKTAEEVSIVAESDKTRIRNAARQIAWSNKILGRQWLSNIIQYPTEWIIRIAGGDGKEDIPIAFSGSMLQKPKVGKLTKENIDLDIVVDDYSMLPSSARDKAELWHTLKQIYGPELPDEDFLEGIGVPNPKYLAMQIAQKREELMAQQAGGPPGAESGGDLEAMMAAGGPPAIPPEAGLPPGSGEPGQEMTPELAQQFMAMMASMGANPDSPVPPLDPNGMPMDPNMAPAPMMEGQPVVPELPPELLATLNPEMMNPPIEGMPTLDEIMGLGR